MKISLRILILIVMACGVAAWIGREWLRPGRLPGQRFALIGPIDLDRDGRDDRARLRAMILSEGGRVDYDLPPMGAAIGKIGPGTGWYVVDERGSLGGPRVPAPPGMAGAIREARTQGIRPMPIEKLLRRMGAK